MRNISELKIRMRAIEQTKQITKAMHMIAVSQMRKSLDLSAANASYFENVVGTMNDILQHSHGVSHPFLEEKMTMTSHTAYIVISGDKGFAGAYNQEVNNLAWRHMQDRPEDEAHIFSVGNMTREFFTKKGMPIDIEFLHTSQNPTLFNARQMADVVLDLYEHDLMDSVYVAFTRMVSHSVQKPMVVQILPVLPKSLMEFGLKMVNWTSEYSGEISYEPSPQAVLDVLIPQYVIGLIFTVLVQSYASEQCMRMQATEHAMRNADEMLASLRLEYNRARQDRITEQIIETAAGANALLKKK